ncbi:cysteine hydrolase family protein [Azospirillum canadense]|uniref:cysteine hydrolase family protein n=1 Tax=Azospirillum canadense TaxID=403962 RepID=UPI0022272540|nr:cysteine hydrolase family protein [Azospirillum canadense]MCW2242568.1 nicotinamidase-related amidase [Azospirillum canadense]
MKQALLIIDVQPCFNPPAWQVEKISQLALTMHSVATVERHDEAVTPFERQLGWKPAAADEPLVLTDKVFVKHGYLPPPELIDYLKSMSFERVLVCGIQADTCCLAAGFMLFDAGFFPTLLKWLTVGSSLDRSASLGAKLWKHHFGAASVLHNADEFQSCIPHAEAAEAAGDLS